MKKYYRMSEADFAKSKCKVLASAGPRPNIKGMREKFWGKNAIIVHVGQYAYRVDRHPQNSH